MLQYNVGIRRLTLDTMLLSIPQYMTKLHQVHNNVPKWLNSLSTVHSSIPHCIRCHSTSWSSICHNFLSDYLCLLCPLLFEESRLVMLSSFSKSGWPHFPHWVQNMHGWQEFFTFNKLRFCALSLSFLPDISRLFDSILLYFILLKNCQS
jgi:hypothetical protein